MKRMAVAMTRGYCIVLDTLCQGPMPIEHDGRGRTVIYARREDAERSIIEDIRERLDLYLEGSLPFEEAVQVEEYVQEVVVGPEGNVLYVESGG